MNGRTRSRRPDAPELRELRREVAGIRRANERSDGGPRRDAGRVGGAQAGGGHDGGGRGGRGRVGAARLGASRVGAGRRRAIYAHRRRRLGVGAALLGLFVVCAVVLSSGHKSFALPSRASLAGLGVGARIVAFANSQTGYRTDPSRSYCNKFSAYWHAGSSGCPAGERSEKWCADFAAWAWRHAGVPFTYGYNDGDINAGAVSFYEWGLYTGHWHPAASGFHAAPGDVAVYGLSFVSGVPSAVHVAVVVSDPRGQAGPDVINGDGDRTGFSVVETGTDEVDADTGDGGDALAGYVSP